MSGLHADSVRKQIGNKQILNDVFISCKPGQIVGLLGRNGSGKSTLLKIIFGSLNADNKYVAVDGKKIDSLFDNRNLINYLPQDNCLPIISLLKISYAASVTGKTHLSYLNIPWSGLS
jgi:ABC-type multidrug transport system ATPase subunit